MRRIKIEGLIQAVGFGHKRRTRVLDEIEREEEAEWMLEQLRLPYGGDRSKQREAVKKVLEFLQVDLYDVPFLWAYRRDYFAPHLPDRAHLWSITRLDDKWEELQRRKSFALARFERFSAGHHGYSSRKAMDQEARKAALQEVEARLKEAEAGVEEWKEKVKTLQDKEDTRMIGGDDEEEDEFAEESASLPQAKEALASFTDQKEAALNDLAALEAEMEAAEREKEKRESNGQWEELEPVEEEEEEELRRLCPDSYRTMLDASREEEGVRDLHEYLGVIGQETSRRAHRLAFDLYRKCRSLKGLRRFASLFSCPAPELGAALHASRTSGGDLDEQHRPLIPTPNMYPENAAAEYTTPSLPKYEEVLRAAKHMLAMELAHEPRLRACFRQIYRAEATLTTHPTIKGHNEITDQFHRLHGFQFINKKPLYEFLQPPSDSQPDLFLRIMQAEREGFITFTIDAPANTAAESTSWTPNGSSAWPSLLQTLEGLYMPYRTASLDTSLVDAWNEQRKDILSLTLSSHILPMLEAEVKREMARKAQEAVVAAAADALREVVNTGTYMPQYRNINCTLIPPFEDFQLRLSQRFPFELTPLSSSSLEVVAVFQASSRQEASFAVSVGRDGAVRDYVMLPPLRSGYDGDADQRDKLQKIIVEAKPAVVVVNAVVGGYEALRMKERLAKVVDNVARLYQHGELAAEDEEGWEPCEVLLIDDHLASVYARSPRVKKEFTDYHDNLRIAIGMARQMQDPLALVTLIYAAQDPRGGRFGGPGYQLSYLSLHDLQDQVNPHELSRRWEEVLVDAVNDVGVDLNKSISSLHLAGLLPFVSGLGFRKANALRAAIRNTHGSLVVSRAQLIEEGLLTPKVGQRGG
ncbi:transcription elongation factor spt6 [Nannochloropsis gaditana]|uniref:Transcription elongation factor spt6 n=1 Tax=Nannochloropsis gaditana TaxID=72520 RepID=W7UB84_9STRA|nr:transcription elongation factor spt6 [Nannochloropsis gaditana]